MSFLPLIALLLPFIGGGSLLLFKPNLEKTRNSIVMSVCALTSILVFFIISYRYINSGDDMSRVFVWVIRDTMELALRVDGASVVFAGIVAILWPITNIYAFEYMHHEHNKNRFFAFFTITYGVVLGIAFSANLFTLYFFYELLTLCTLPLVMHEDDGKAGFAGKKYLSYSMVGASFAFISMLLLSQHGSLDFTLGGSLSANLLLENENFLRMAFLFGFFGFGVKAAVFPFYGWLPSAGVAPTPVTALLHAVAVVNAGLFAVIRIIYYNYGSNLLFGSFAQFVAMSAAIITIIFGSSMALRLKHLKRRLAYSTVSNLSYILLAATLCTTSGLSAALLHLVVHSLIKISLFFCAGALLCQTHHTKNGIKEYIWQYEGFGKKMPLVFGMYLVASLGLIGIPPFAGFASKWSIATAAVGTGLNLAIVGCFALVCSAFLTGLYQFEVLRYAFFPREGFKFETLEEIKDPKWKMKTAFVSLLVLMAVLSVFMKPLIETLARIASGNF